MNNKILSCLLLLLFCLTNCNSVDNEQYISKLVVTNYNGIDTYYYNELPFNGTVLDKQEENNKIVNFHVNKGVKNGKYLETSLDGNVIVDAFYLNGFLHGIYTSYFSNNQIKELKNYEKGFLNGKRKYFWPNGMIKEENTYINGRMIHFSNFYFSNGIVRKSIYFDENGKRDGIWTEYHSNGNIKDCTIYKKGKLMSNIKYEKNGIKINN